MNDRMFFSKDGKVSSIINILLPNTYTTDYPSDHTRGGTTIVNKYAISRYDKSGRLMSFGIPTGKGGKAQYFDKNFRPISKITPF